MDTTIVEKENANLALLNAKIALDLKMVNVFLAEKIYS